MKEKATCTSRTAVGHTETRLKSKKPMTALLKIGDTAMKAVRR